MKYNLHVNNVLQNCPCYPSMPLYERIVGLCLQLTLNVPLWMLGLCIPVGSLWSLFCSHSFPSPGSFPNSHLFTTGGQSIAASGSASVLPVNIQGWFFLFFVLGLAILILLSKGFLSVFSSTTVRKHSSVLRLPYSPTFTPTLDGWKNHSFDSMDLCQQRDVSAF